MEFNTQLAQLKKQVKILTACLVSLAVLVIILLVSRLQIPVLPDNGWPDANINKLNVKTIVITSSDGTKLGIIGTDKGEPFLSFMDKDENHKLFLGINDTRGIALFEGGGDTVTSLSNGNLLMGNEKKGYLSLQGPPIFGPRLSLKDPAGFGAVLGEDVITDPTDGRSTVTSAASLTGISKDRSLITDLLLSRENQKSSTQQKAVRH